MLFRSPLPDMSTSNATLDDVTPPSTDLSPELSEDEEVVVANGQPVEGGGEGTKKKRKKKKTPAQKRASAEAIAKAAAAAAAAAAPPFPAVLKISRNKHMKVSECAEVQAGGA